MEPVELNSTPSDAAASEDSFYFAAVGGLSLPYPSSVSKDHNGLVLRYIRFVDALFPEKRSWRNISGGICNRILTMRGWRTWLLSASTILALIGIGLHTISWMSQDGKKEATRPALYLAFISFIWEVEQFFCVVMRPIIPLRSMQGYIRDWSPIKCRIPILFCFFAIVVFMGNLAYGLYSTFSTLGIRGCIPSQPMSYSAVYGAISNCTLDGVSLTDQNNLASMVGGFGQALSAHPASSVLITFIYLVASLVWTTTPLQFAIVMMLNVIELRSARGIISAELLAAVNNSDSAETVLKRVHKHIVAADVGSCRCNEVFGIVIAGNLILDLSLIAVLLSALQDPAYQKNSVLLPVTAFWMTASCVHMCAFLLPMAAYNSNLRGIQNLLYRYSARLNGVTTPDDNLAAWAKPLDTGLLKRLHAKVIFRAFVSSQHRSLLPPHLSVHKLRVPSSSLTLPNACCR